MKSDITKEKRDDLVKRLGYIRCWIQGFEAAGKTGPHDSDVLRQVQMILKDMK